VRKRLIIAVVAIAAIIVLSMAATLLFAPGNDKNVRATGATNTQELRVGEYLVGINGLKIDLNYQNFRRYNANLLFYLNDNTRIMLFFSGSPENAGRIAYQVLQESSWVSYNGIPRADDGFMTNQIFGRFTDKPFIYVQNNKLIFNFEFEPQPIDITGIENIRFEMASNSLLSTLPAAVFGIITSDRNIEVGIRHRAVEFTFINNMDSHIIFAEMRYRIQAGNHFDIASNQFLPLTLRFNSSRVTNFDDHQVVFIAYIDQEIADMLEIDDEYLLVQLNFVFIGYPLFPSDSHNNWDANVVVRNASAISSNPGENNSDGNSGGGSNQNIIHAGHHRINPFIAMVIVVFGLIKIFFVIEFLHKKSRKRGRR